MGTGSSPRRRTAKVLLYAIGGFAAASALVFVGVFALATYAFSGLHWGGGSHSFGRKHLDPIPISQRACPYVKAMHLGAVGFQDAEPGFLGWLSVDDKTQKVVVDGRTWSQHK